MEVDPTGRYLQFLNGTANVVIDMQERKVAALYAADRGNGCLIGSEFWTCVGKKICRKPFPAFEEIPVAKPVFNWGIDYSKHPQLW